MYVHCAMCDKSIRSKTVKNVHDDEPFVQFGDKCAVCNMKCALGNVTRALCKVWSAGVSTCVLGWEAAWGAFPRGRSTPLCHHHCYRQCRPRNDHYHPGDPSLT